MLKRYLLFCGVAAVATATACGDGKKAPTPSAPSELATDAELGPDNSTLKASAPGLLSPANNAELEELENVRLTIRGATATYTTATLAHRIQLLDAAGNVVQQQLGNGLTMTIPELEDDTTYRWRARAELGSSFGPWSAVWSFVTAAAPDEGYNIPGELYDPLLNGKTVGTPVGSINFIRGEGIRLNNFESHVRYLLPQTVTGGEFSMFISNVPANTEGNKTKVFCMSEGLSDIVTNDRRFTVEKRGDPAGVVAWRFITREDQIDTVGKQRVRVDFLASRTYYWRATWGSNRFNLSIRDGGVDGNVVYSFGKPYGGVYNPSPHYAFLGGPRGRSGIQAALVPGMTVSQVWISARPRPDFANNPRE